MHKGKVNFSLIVLLSLASIRFWSFGLIPDQFYDLLDDLIVVFLVGTIIKEKLKYGNIKKGAFSTNIVLFIALPYISSIGAYLYHGQSILDSFLTLRMHFYWLFYFVLHYYNVDVNKLVKLMIVIGLVWAILNIVQQFTYPSYWFYSRSDTADTSILRAGVYRFMPFRHQYGMFAIFYFFYQYLRNRKTNNIIYVLVGLAGFYFFGTRQFLAITIISLGVMLLWMNQGKRFFAMFLFLASVGVLIYFQDILLGKFIELSSEDVNEDNIRLLAYDYYFNTYWPDDIFSRIIGNGHNHSYKGSYAMEISRLEQDLRIYRSDIGIIGSYNKFGLLYVGAIFWYNIKGMRDTYYTQHNRFIKLFFLGSLLLLPLSVYYSHQSAIPFFCIITYIVEKGFKLKESSKKLTNLL